MSKSWGSPIHSELQRKQVEIKMAKRTGEQKTVLAASPSCHPEVPILHISTVNSPKCTPAPLALLGNDPVFPFSSREGGLQ